MTIPGLVLSLLSGVLLSLSFTPWSVWWLAWVALIPVFAALLRFAPTRIGFGLYCALAAMTPLYSMSLGLPAEYLAVYALPLMAGIGVFLFTFWQRDLALGNGGRWFPLLAGCGIAGVEFLRHGWVLGSFASLGLTQYTQPATIQIAALTGVFGVSLMLVFANAALAVLIVNIRNPRPALLPVGYSVGVVVLLMAANLVLLRADLPETGRVVAAAVQLGFVPEAAEQPPELRELDAAYEARDSVRASRAALDLLEPLTREAAGRGARLVVWPEAVLDAGPDEFDEVAERLSALALETSVYLAFGYVEYLPGAESNDTEPPYRNMAAIMDPDGVIIHRYHKQRYVRMAGIEQGPHGEATTVALTGLGVIGLTICYDADFPDIPAVAAALGAELIVSPSHDLAGFLTRHHPSMQLFRAVENRRSLIKSDFVHGTLIVGPKGHILADPPDGLGIALAEVPLTAVRTIQPFGMYIFGWGCVAVFLLAALLARRRR